MSNSDTWQELVDQRRENQRLRKKLKRKRRWKKLNDALTAVILVSLAILFTRVTPVDPGIVVNGSGYEVVVSEEQVDVFDQHYTTELENGFCLYGNVEDEQVVVDEVVPVDEPRKQSRGSISFTCVPETLNRLPKLLTHGDFGFLGIVHTHPSGSPRLSRSDAAILGSTFYLVKISGIYNGDEVEFYSFDDPRYSMPVQVT